jgi:hypothetical protein
MKAGGAARVVALILLAIAFGAVGLTLIFSDLGPEETAAERAFMTVMYCFFSAALIGYLNPRLWPIGVLTAWGGLFLGFPIASALLGAFVGSVLKSKRVIPRLLDRMFPRS